MISANAKIKYYFLSRGWCGEANMEKRLTLASILVGVIVMGAAFLAVAQNKPSAERYKVRLSPVPVNVSMLSTVAGSGSLTAVLSGKQLTITGTFEGMHSPATTAQIHMGFRGIRGPAILDITVSKAEKGNVEGTLELTPEQIEALRNSKLYVQIQSERAPEGNLWGWLLK
jgi:hypothetical protein